MAVTSEQLRKLQDIKRGLFSDRDSQKGDSWEKITRFILPELEEPQNRKPIFATEAMQYTDISANALQGWAYGRSISWIHLEREGRMVKGEVESRDVTAWLEDNTRLLVEDIGRSSFYDEALTVTRSAFNLSTGIMTMDWDEENQLPVYEAINPRKAGIAQDNFKKVDVLMYEFRMDKDSAEHAYGDKCPKVIRDSKDYTKRWTFTKALLSSKRFDLDIPGEDEWMEVIWAEDDRKNTCSERRLKYLPFVCWRFGRPLTGEVWGCNSPGERCIPEVVAMNAMKKAKLKAVQLRLDPPVKATEGLELNIKPAGITYLEGNQDYQFATLPGSTEETTAEIQMMQQTLKEAYYVDFFLVLQQTMQQQKTATEASLLADEKSQIMASFTSRLNNEFLEPILDTLFQMEMDHGRLSEPPEELYGQDIRVDFISPLAIAQRKAQIYQPAKQFMAETLSFAQIDPSVQHIFKIPEYAEQMAKDLQVDLRFINSPEEVQKKMDEQKQMAMQQMQAEQANQQAQTEANVYNALSKAPEEGSAAQQMLGGGQ